MYPLVVGDPVAFGIEIDAIFLEIGYSGKEFDAINP